MASDAALLTFVNVWSEAQLYSLDFRTRIFESFYKVFWGEICTHVENHGIYVGNQSENTVCPKDVSSETV